MKWKKNDSARTEICILLILAVMYLAGLVTGQVFSDNISLDLTAELNRYLSDYLQLDKSRISLAETFWNTFLLYIRYPVVAFFLGFAAIGVIFVPCLSFLLGLGLSFSVGCFSAAFPSKGLLICCASFGLRVLITLPCFLLLAVPAWLTAWRLFSVVFGRGHRRSDVIFAKIYWLRFVIVFLILLFGVLLDILLTPKFLEMILT